MKRFLTPLLFTLTCLLSISANSGAPSYFIPNEPSITAPIANAVDVDNTPELTSSEFSFTREGGGQILL